MFLLAADPVGAETERTNGAAAAAVFAIDREIATVRIGIGPAVGLARSAGGTRDARAAGHIKLLIVGTGHTAAAVLIGEVAHLTAEGVRAIITADGEGVTSAAIRTAGRLAGIGTRATAIARDCIGEEAIACLAADAIADHATWAVRRAATPGIATARAGIATARI